MLRLFVLLLLVANGFFYAWSNGYLSQWGWVASTQRESFRLNEQIEPDRIIVRPADKKPPPATITPISATVNPPTAQTAVSPTKAATICLTAGTFNDRQSSSIKQTLDAQLPSVRWRFDAVNIPARWIVYMGKYPNNNAREVKKKQLDEINVRYEILTESKLEPG